VARKIFLAGNWKMNMLAAQVPSYFLDFQQELDRPLAEIKGGVDLAFAVPYPLLAAVHQQDSGSFFLAAQNVHAATSGAYTGEVSIAMLKEAGAFASLVGHSERRQYYGETDESVAEKTKALLSASMLPIVCIGETKGQRESGATKDVLQAQISAVTQVLDPGDQVVFAYEPVWAIGTGLTATDDQAQEAHAFIRSLLGKALGEDFAERTRIVYGGSAKPENFAGLLTQKDIDGGLVGGASLQPKAFAAMANLALAATR